MIQDLFSVTVLIGILASGIRLATPYLYAAIGETFGQKSGVLNLGVEGQMLLGAFAVFVLHGSVLWKVGLLMGAGQFLGAQLGSRFAMRQGARIIKPLLVTVSIALAIRLLADPQHPLRVWAGF